MCNSWPLFHVFCRAEFCYTTPWCGTNLAMAQPMFPPLTLLDGRSMPSLGLGVYRCLGDSTTWLNDPCAPPAVSCGAWLIVQIGFPGVFKIWIESFDLIRLFASLLSTHLFIVSLTSVVSYCCLGESPCCFGLVPTCLLISHTQGVEHSTQRLDDWCRPKSSNISTGLVPLIRLQLR